MRKYRFRIGTMVIVALLIMSLGISTMAQPDPAAGNGMNSIPSAPINPNEVPLGAPATNPGPGSSLSGSAGLPGSTGLDLQIAGNSTSASGGGEMGGMEPGMDKMEGMDQMMMGQMGGMNNQNTMNGATTSGMSGDHSTILAQLQATNSMILQMITMLSSQSNSGNLQPQLQMLYQMMANQTALIQMLNNASLSMPQGGNSGGMNMGGASGGGGMGMGMM